MIGHQSWYGICHDRPRGGGGDTSILKHSGAVPRWWPSCLGFSIWLGPYFIPQHNPTAEKIGLSLSHLVQEILGPKVGLIFYQNVFFNRFYIIFPLIFDPNDPFFIDFKSFDPLFSQNLRSNWVQICITCWTPVPNMWWSKPCPPPGGMHNHCRKMNTADTAIDVTSNL